jgi:hypothetical protein
LSEKGKRGGLNPERIYPPQTLPRPHYTYLTLKRDAVDPLDLRRECSPISYTLTSIRCPDAPHGLRFIKE